MTDAISSHSRRMYNAQKKTRDEAAEAKLAKVEEDRDDALIALASARKQLERYIGEAEAALPAVYRLGVRDGATHIFSMENDGSKPQWIHQGSWAHTIEHASHRAQQSPTPTAAELMARIQTGEKE